MINTRSVMRRPLLHESCRARPHGIVLSNGLLTDDVLNLNERIAVGDVAFRKMCESVILVITTGDAVMRCVALHKPIHQAHRHMTVCFPMGLCL